MSKKKIIGATVGTTLNPKKIPAWTNGLKFDGGTVDENGYLHLTLDGVDIEGFEPIYIGSAGNTDGTGLSEEEIRAIINSGIQIVSDDVNSLGQTVEKLQQDVGNIDTEGYTYYATYGKATLLSGEEVDNVFKVSPYTFIMSMITCVSTLVSEFMYNIQRRG